jgi:thiosulfate sulfurtransferase
MVDEITPAELRAQMTDGPGAPETDPSLSVVDIRDPSSYAAGHIEGAVNVPPARLSTDALDASWADAEEVVVSCYIGKSSKQVADALDRHLDADVTSLRGGFEAWDGPTDDGRSAADGRDASEGPEAPF